MSAWTRADRLALASIVVGVLASLVSFFVPEVREGLGLSGKDEHSKHRAVAVEPLTNTDTAPVEGTSSEAEGSIAAPNTTSTTLTVPAPAELPKTNASVATSVRSFGDDSALRKRVVDAPTPAELREATEHLARHFAANATGNYTVFFAIFCDPSNVQKVVGVSEEIWFVPQPIGARKCYRFFWGRFGTLSDAESAIAQVPATIKDRSTRVVPVPRS